MRVYIKSSKKGSLRVGSLNQLCESALFESTLVHTDGFSGKKLFLAGDLSFIGNDFMKLTGKAILSQSF